MTQELTLVARLIVSVAIFFTTLSIAPEMISAPDDGAVFFGICTVIAGIIGTAITAFTRVLDSVYRGAIDYLLK